MIDTSIDLQENNGVQLLSANSSQLEIDTTGMVPCILTTAPSDCTNGGATYMFWIKQLNGEKGAIVTSPDWGPVREGIRISASNDGKLKAAIFREGVTLNRFHGRVSGFNNHLNSWLHVAIIWYKDPRFEIFFNGRLKTVTQDINYASSSITNEAQMRMKLGVEYITRNTDVKTRNMIIDNLIFCDRPLTQADIDIIV